MKKKEKKDERKNKLKKKTEKKKKKKRKRKKKTLWESYTTQFPPINQDFFSFFDI